MNDLIKGLDQSWRGIRSLTRTIEPHQLALPTPCEDWNVRDLLAHLGAAESFFQGFDQPTVPTDWVNRHTGLDFATAQGVAARRDWSLDEVADEIETASKTQLDRLAGLDDQGWQGDAVGPMGPTTQDELARIRTFDIFTHLLDLRFALGEPLDASAEPDAAATATGWVIERSGWGAVKQAGLPDGSRVRLDLTGPGARCCDVVVNGKRGAVVAASGESCENHIEGSAIAYMLMATGRIEPAASIGLPKAIGPLGEALLSSYRLFEQR